MGGVASNFLPQRPAKKMLTIVPSLHAINFYKKTAQRKEQERAKDRARAKELTQTTFASLSRR
jgi:hypothetical protein